MHLLMNSAAKVKSCFNAKGEHKGRTQGSPLPKSPGCAVGAILVIALFGRDFDQGSQKKSGLNKNSIDRRSVSMYIAAG